LLFFFLPQVNISLKSQNLSINNTVIFNS
jgi:hypothetical protein